MRLFLSLILFLIPVDDSTGIFFVWVYNDLHKQRVERLNSCIHEDCSLHRYITICQFNSYLSVVTMYCNVCKTTNVSFSFMHFVRRRRILFIHYSCARYWHHMVFAVEIVYVYHTGMYSICTQKNQRYSFVQFSFLCSQFCFCRNYVSYSVFLFCTMVDNS